MVAAYLVGSRGTAKHAVLLGVIVTAAHTAGVYFLGALTLYASLCIVPEQLYPWLGATGSASADLPPASQDIAAANKAISDKPTEYAAYNLLATALVRRAQERSDVSFYTQPKMRSRDRWN